MEKTQIFTLFDHVEVPIAFLIIVFFSVNGVMLITYLSLSSTALTTRKVSYKDIILVGAKKICNQNISLVSYLFESQLTVTPYIIADRIVVACKAIVGAVGDIES